MGGGEVLTWVVGSATGSLAQEVAQSGLTDRVLQLEGNGLESYTPGGYRRAGLRAAEASMPDLVLLPHTYQSVEFAPRLAWDLQAAWVPEVVGYELEASGIRWKRPVLGGKLVARVAIKPGSRAVVTVQAGAANVKGRGESPAVPVEQLQVSLRPEELEREVLGVEQAAVQEVNLGAAEVIVAVGRGVGGMEKLGIVRELAELLGAELAASRPAVDAGWLPRDRQIGSSGQTVAPRLYLALGISGAIQHLVGMKGSRSVVAINKDPSAPIFKVAHLGLVGDLHEILPLAVQKLRERRQGLANS
jgi:electron transfer flavoprotein alpha subunit